MPSVAASITSPPLFIFIMAGGSGERFWPMSRKKNPKHLLRLLGEKTLLAQTVERFEGIVPREQIFILTNHLQREATLQALPNHPPKNIIAEPAKRDTAPAATLATALALRADTEAIVGLFPADATIHDTVTFQRQLLEAAAMAAHEPALITFAIKPTSPSTSFGYLDLGENFSSDALDVAKNEKTIFRTVTRFVEKPPLAEAEKFCLSGHHAWNAGMFLWRGKSFLAECEKQQPTLATFLKECLEVSSPENYLEKAFSHLPKISVDYAIMEKAEHVIAAVAEFDWDDVGHWTALPKHLGVDKGGNTLKVAPEKIVMQEASNNIVVSEGKPIALCDVHNLIVVQTADALLICHRDSVEKIKLLLLPEELK